MCLFCVLCLSFFLCHLVFQSKVLQKLYPAAPKLEKQPSPPRIVDALSRKTYVKRKASQQDTAIGKLTLSSPVILAAYKSTKYNLLNGDVFLKNTHQHTKTPYTQNWGLLPSLICHICLRRYRDTECSHSRQADVHSPTSSCRLQDRFREICHTSPVRKHK